MGLCYGRAMLEQAPPADLIAEQASTTGSGRRRVWLVFADQLTTRIFLECGIVDELREALPGPTERGLPRAREARATVARASRRN